MCNVEMIRKAVQQAAREYPIKRIELFGSYANGSATEDSDLIIDRRLCLYGA